MHLLAFMNDVRTPLIGWRMTVFHFAGSTFLASER